MEYCVSLKTDEEGTVYFKELPAGTAHRETPGSSVHGHLV